MMKNVAVKAIIMVAIEISNKIKPHMSFSGNDLRKSLSAYRDVRIDKNININAVEVNNDIASEMAKMTKHAFLTKMGLPLLSTAPGSWNVAEKATVAIRVATRAHDSAVFVIHFSPLLLNASCSSLNNTWGVFWSSFSASAYSGLTISLTACIPVTPQKLFTKACSLHLDFPFM